MAPDLVLLVILEKVDSVSLLFKALCFIYKASLICVLFYLAGFCVLVGVKGVLTSSMAVFAFFANFSAYLILFLAPLISVVVTTPYSACAIILASFVLQDSTKM
jgi:hypothetical protein